MYHLQIKELRVRYEVEALYKNSRTGAITPAPVVPVDFVPLATSFASSIPLNGSGYLTTVL